MRTSLITAALVGCAFDHTPCPDGEFKQGPMTDSTCQDPPPVPDCHWDSYYAGQCDTYGHGFCTDGARASYYFDGVSESGTVSYVWPDRCTVTYTVWLEPYD